jgi:hypothetical protein
MKKLYCVDCGNGTSYLVEKPNFCGKCGHVLAGSAGIRDALGKTCPKGHRGTAGTRGTKAKETAYVENETDPYEGEDIMYVPRLDGLEVDIELPETNKGTRLEDLLGTSGGTNDMSAAFSERDQSESETLEELQNESKTLRPNG